MEKVNVTERVNVFGKRRCRVSWGSIIGGVMTVLAVSFLLSLIGTAIGLFMYDPTDAEPFWGVGTSVGIWTVISLLISLAAGGFVAGKLATRDGFIHGFLTWATALIIAVVFGAMMASSAVKMAGNLLGSLSSVTGNILSGVGSAVADGSSDMASFFDNIDIKGDINDGKQDIRRTLRKTGVKEFQPEYVQQQVNAVKADLRRSVKQLAANPKYGDRVIDGFTTRLQNRIDNYTSNIDREKLVTALMNSENMTRAQAESTVDQYSEILEEGRESLNDLQYKINNAKQEWEQTKQEALVKSEQMATKAAWTAIWSFLALLVGAALAGFCGRFGADKTREGYDM